MFIELANGTVKDVPYQMEKGVAKRVLGMGARILSLSSERIAGANMMQQMPTQIGQTVMQDKYSDGALYNLALKWAVNGVVLSDEEYMNRQKSVTKIEEKRQEPKNGVELNIKMTRKEMKEAVETAGLDWNDKLTKQQIIDLYGTR